MNAPPLPPAVADLLDRCLVRIDGRDGFVGNGFLVGPDLVVTCAHVVHAAGHRMTLRWVGGELDTARVSLFPADAGTSDSYPYPDLALVRVTPVYPATSPRQWVWLAHEDPRQGATLYVRGISRYATPLPTILLASPERDGLTLHVAAPSGQFLRARADRIVPGLSGSPALDAHTGQIRAIVKSTLDDVAEQGGHLIPVEELRRLLTGELPEQVTSHAAQLWRTAVHAPVANTTNLDVPPAVRRAVRLISVREWLCYLTMGTMLVAAAIAVIAAAAGPHTSDGFASALSGYITVASLICAAVVAIAAIPVMWRLAQWFHRMATTALVRRADRLAAIRWIIGELAAALALACALPPRAAIISLAAVMLSLVTLITLLDRRTAAWSVNEDRRR